MYCNHSSSGICTHGISPLTDGAMVPSATLDRPNLPIVIDASVGKNGANLPKDVRLIQRALNAVRIEDGGADPLLKVDGFNGPKTEAAIENFQLQQFGPSNVDKLVEPRKRTVVQITTVLAAAMRTATLADFAAAIGIDEQQIQEGIDAAFEIARRWLLDANIRLLVFGDRVDPLVEKYFKISRQPSRHAALSTIKRVLVRMKEFVDTPAAERAFRPEPLIRSTTTIAWCEFGGLDIVSNTLRFLPGPDGTNWPTHANEIYYTMRFVLLLSRDAMAYAIVHELAHFVSRNPHISDFAYRHRDPAGFAALSPTLRVHNADTYAMYVLEAGTGSDTPLIRPDPDE